MEKAPTQTKRIAPQKPLHSGPQSLVGALKTLQLKLNHPICYLGSDSTEGETFHSVRLHFQPLFDYYHQQRASQCEIWFISPSLPLSLFTRDFPQILNRDSNKLILATKSFDYPGTKIGRNISVSLCFVLEYFHNVPSNILPCFSLFFSSNSGFWGYDSWLPTLKCIPPGTPFVSTAYSQEECIDDLDTLEDLHSFVWKWKPSPNPFHDRNLPKSSSPFHRNKERLCPDSYWQCFIQESDSDTIALESAKS